MKKIAQNFTAVFFILVFGSFTPPILMGAEAAPERPHFYLNGKLETPTIQELGGIGARPLRCLVERNNKSHKDEWVQVYAMGTHQGDDLKIEWGAPAAGMRVSVYKLMKNSEGDRFFTLPLSIFHGEEGKTVYQEKIAPYRSEYLIITFEKTDSPHKKSANLLYFEDKKRNLLVKSMRPNLKLTSLKLKMQDVASQEKSFTFDVQELIDRFINPQRIFIIRLWKDERCCLEMRDLS